MESDKLVNKIIISLALVVFEIAMKNTLKLCFGRRSNWNPTFCFVWNSYLGQMSLHTKFHHPSSCSFGDSYEKDINFVCLKDNLNWNTIFLSLNLLVGVRWACIQNFIILAIVVFELAVKKTLNLCFARRPKLKTYFFAWIS